MATEPEKTVRARSVQGKWRAKRAPKPKDSSEPKTAYLGLRLPEEEYQAIEEAAREASETVSEYVRIAIAQRLEGRVHVMPEASMTYGVQFIKVTDSKASVAEGKSLVVIFPPSSDLPSQKVPGHAD